MDRRVFLQTSGLIASTAVVNQQIALATVAAASIDLRIFVGLEGPSQRFVVSEPFVIDHCKYATDCAIVVRIPCSEIPTDRSKLLFPMADALFSAEFWGGGQAVGKWHPWPAAKYQVCEDGCHSWMIIGNRAIARGYDEKIRKSLPEVEWLDELNANPCDAIPFRFCSGEGLVMPLAPQDS